MSMFQVSWNPFERLLQEFKGVFSQLLKSQTKEIKEFIMSQDAELGFAIAELKTDVATLVKYVPELIAKVDELTKKVADQPELSDDIAAIAEITALVKGVLPVEEPGETTGEAGPNIEPVEPVE